MSLVLRKWQDLGIDGRSWDYLEEWNEGRGCSVMAMLWEFGELG